MKLRTVLTVLTTAGVFLAGAASARASVGPPEAITVEGPSAVVWTGECPSTVDEKDIGLLSEVCRNLGYRLATANLQTVSGLGGNKMTAVRDGKVVRTVEITQTTWTMHYLELNAVRTCTIVNGAIDMTRDCTYSGPGGESVRPGAGRSAKRKRAKHR